MKRNRTFTFIMLLLIVLDLSACSSQKLSGKYINIYDEAHYIIFSNDDSFIDSYLTTTSKGNAKISDNYIYKIDDNGLITIIDTTEYEGQESLYKYELGYLYNDNIGIWFDGTLPINNDNTSISCLLNGYKFEYYFDDETYKYTTTSNNEIVHSENGTYIINDNEVVCISEDGTETTFISAEDRIFCIEYIKE